MGTENPHEYCLFEDGIQSILQDEADKAQIILLFYFIECALFNTGHIFFSIKISFQSLIALT